MGDIIIFPFFSNFSNAKNIFCESHQFKKNPLLEWWGIFNARRNELDIDSFHLDEERIFIEVTLLPITTVPAFSTSLWSKCLQ